MKFVRLTGIGLIALAAACASDHAGERSDQASSAASGAPLSMLIVAKSGDIASVEAADERARIAAANLDLAVRRTMERMGAALTTDDLESNAGPARKDLRASESELDALLERAWGRVVLDGTRDVDVTLALRLAILETHVELRRLLGPKFRSSVPGLSQREPCQQDIISDRVFANAAYALQDSGDPMAEATGLAPLATAIACLGTRQVMTLDVAFPLAMEGVERRLSSKSLSGVIPGYLRATAPVALLVLDARKHAGARSATHGWFASHEAPLKASVVARGWSPSRTVFTYNRRSGGLVGIPECAGTPFTGCVDAAALISSIVDPLAIGLGGCGFDAMIARGLRNTARGHSRYICPSIECVPSTGSTAITSASEADALARYRAIWPTESTATDSVIKTTLCLPAGSASANLAASAPDACVAELSAGAQSSPFDDYLGCIAEGVSGSGIGPDGLIDSFGGVPVGKDCVLSDGADTTTTEPPPSPPEEERSAWETFWSWWGEAIEEVLVKRDLTNALGDDKIDLTQFQDIQSLPTVTEKRAALDKALAEHQGCVDQSRCGNACTGLSQQVSKASACSEALVAHILNQAGIPARTVPPRRSLGPVINPNPEAQTDERSGAGACLIGTGDPNRSSSACSLVMCAGTTMSDSGGTGAGCCGGRISIVAVSSRHACYALDCGDGNAVVDPVSGQCSCELGGAIITPPPKPGPVGE